MTALWGCLGLQAFKDGVPLKNGKRLASELEVAEQGEKARRKTYMKSIEDRSLTHTKKVMGFMRSLVVGDRSRGSGPFKLNFTCVWVKSQLEPSLLSGITSFKDRPNMVAPLHHP